MTAQVWRARLGPADRTTSPYREVPFDVVGGAFELSLSYDGSAGVVDLGCRGPAGFRGWSGGARRRIAVSPSGTTPGYLRGPAEDGRWHAVLGLHRLPAEGLDVEVSVQVPAPRGPDPAPQPPPVPPRPRHRVLPAADGLQWRAGDLHAHTVHSDGSLTVDELAAGAVAAGLDFLAVTDHNTTSHHAELPAAARRFGVDLVPGQELTTDRGHANAFGDVGWVDFREHPDHWAEAVERAGGLLSINHPLAADCAWQHRMHRRPPLAEVWHWTWTPRTWSGPLAWWSAWGLDTVPIGGSDFHSPAQGRPLGRPTTWVACEQGGPDAVLAGMAAGRTAVSAGRNEAVLLRVGDELVALDADGTVLLDVEGQRRLVRGDLARFPAGPGLHRLETPAAAVVAITG